YGLRILSAGEMMQWFVAQVRRAFSGVYVLAAMVLVVVLVGVADTLAAGVFERTRDIGVLRAVGIDRREVRRIGVMEGMVLAGLGLGMALVCGLVLGVLWVRGTFPYLVGWVLDLYIPYMELALMGITVVAVCVLAAIIPARYAARLEPALALRYE